MSSKKPKGSRKRSRPIEPKKSKLDPKILAIIVFIAIIIVIAVGIQLLGNNENENDITPDGNPIAIIGTSKGIIKVELFQDKMPKTCDNFIKLANEGFYDEMIFHRISDDFMIQAGYMFPDGSTKSSPYENIEFEINEEVKHVDGAISMASTGAGVGGSSQFFICDGAQSLLDGSYAAFGVVVEGLEVVKTIASSEHDSSLEPQPGGGKPLTDIIINSIKIEN